MAANVIPLQIESEIAPLEAVVVHRPGVEIEQMTPDRAGELLYNDIVPMSTVAAEHSRLVEILSAEAEVFEISDLLTRALEQESIRTHLLDCVCGSRHAARRRDELSSLDASGLAQAVITGLRKRPSSLEEYLSPRSWDISPLPNLYFMRDAGFVFRDRAAAGAMAHPVRDLEAAVNSAVFRAMSAETDGERLLLDGASIAPRRGDNQYYPSVSSANANHKSRPSERELQGTGEQQPPRDRDIRLEGGDIHVLAPDLLLVGISDRTSTRAVDLLCASIVETFAGPLRVIACLLPRKRSCIHLDMVFSRIDHEYALVHAPVVFGPSAMRTVRFDLEPGASPRVREGGSLLSALSEAGCEVKPVVCGGSDPLHQEREQWLSGTNAFTLAPGRVLVYDCNRYTLDELDKAGYSVVMPEEYRARRAVGKQPGSKKQPNGSSANAAEVIALPGAELARGGGGPRCMTMPIRRERLYP